LSTSQDISFHGYRFIPLHISFDAYEYIFKTGGQIIQSYKISLFVSFFGTFLSVSIMALCGYPLARRNFKYRRPIMFFIFFTMLFSGGLVPTYMLVANYLGMQNTVWALFIPTLINAWTIIVMRTFFQKLPEEMFESAKIDGAGEFLIFGKLVLPLSVPILATMGLFGVLNRWNEWFPALLYIDNPDLFPIQYLLQRIMQDLQMVRDMLERGIAVNMADQLAIEIPKEPARMAICIVAAGPMIFVFPFFQRYFVKGITIGSLKG
jgi:putative aldouronate transport system permease protein